MPLQTGDIAPDFSAPDQRGLTRSLADYRGTYLLLYFYPKDDTPGCTTEACAFRDIEKEMSDKIVIVGVSADSVESHLKFAGKYKLPFTLLADPERKIIDAYGANSMLFGKRTSFLIDPKGIIKKIYEKVDAAAHPKQVMEDVMAF